MGNYSDFSISDEDTKIDDNKEFVKRQKYVCEEEEIESERNQHLTPTSPVSFNEMGKGEVLNRLFEEESIRRNEISPENGVQMAVTMKNYNLRRKNVNFESIYDNMTHIEYRFTLPERYQPIKYIGRGAFGFVVACYDKFTRRNVAVKAIRLSDDSTEVKRQYDRRGHKLVLRELLILKHFRGCRNILGLIDVFLLNDGVSQEATVDDFDVLYVVTDLLDRDLWKKIENDAPIPERIFKRIMHESFKGLRCVHRSNIFHRDIKSQNILIREGTKEEDMVVKICDFGLSRGMDLNDNLSFRNIVTLPYRSPEILMGWKKANRESDMWAMGCVLGEFCSGKKGSANYLFKGDMDFSILNSIVDLLGTPRLEDLVGGELFKKYVEGNLGGREKVDLTRHFGRPVSQACIDLLEKLLDYNPITRINVEEALQHEWFRDLRKEEENIPLEEVEEFKIRVSEDLKREEIRDMLFKEVEIWKENSKYYKNAKIVFENGCFVFEDHDNEDQDKK